MPCHNADGVSGFPLDTYQRAAGRADMSTRPSRTSSPLGCSAEKQTASWDTDPVNEPLAVNLAGVVAMGALLALNLRRVRRHPAAA